MEKIKKTEINALPINEQWWEIVLFKNPWEIEREKERDDNINLDLDAPSVLLCPFDNRTLLACPFSLNRTRTFYNDDDDGHDGHKNHSAGAEGDGDDDAGPPAPRTF
jgi:hypothetical protein